MSSNSLSSKSTKKLKTALYTKLELPIEIPYKERLKDFLNQINLCQKNYSSLKRFFEVPKNFEFLINIYLKTIKNNIEIDILNTYLQTLENFISLIHSDQNIGQLNKLLSLINKDLKVKIYPYNTILFKIGEVGVHFYLILYGKISILIPEEIYFKTSFENYKQHLLNLYIMNETYLLKQTINSNNHLFDIDINDFDTIKNNKYKEIYSTFRSQFSLNDYLNIINYKVSFDIISYINENKDKFNKKPEKASKNINKKSCKILSSLLKNQVLFSKNDDKYHKKTDAYKLKNKFQKRDTTIGLEIKRDELSKLNNINDLASSFKLDDQNQNQNNDYQYFSYAKNNKMTENFKIYENNELKYVIKIIGYKNISTLTNGQSLGELSLVTENNLRTSTVFIESKSIMGSLSKSSYFNTIKTAQQKIKKDSCLFILNTKLFGRMPYFKFFNKYLLYFTTHKLNKGNYLFKVGEECDNIYIINQGEVKLDCHLDENGIQTIIQFLENKDVLTKLKTLEEEKKQKLKIKSFNSIISKEQHLCLLIMKRGDILGLKDVLFLNNKYYCNAEVVSDNLTYYKIQKKIFNQFYEKSICIKEGYNQIEKVKKNLMIERLKEFKNINNKFRNKILDDMSCNTIKNKSIISSNEERKIKTFFKPREITIKTNSLSLIKQEINKSINNNLSFTNKNSIKYKSRMNLFSSKNRLLKKEKNFFENLNPLFINYDKTVNYKKINFNDLSNSFSLKFYKTSIKKSKSFTKKIETMDYKNILIKTKGKGRSRKANYLLNKKHLFLQKEMFSSGNKKIAKTNPFINTQPSDFSPYSNYINKTNNYYYKNHIIKSAKNKIINLSLFNNNNEKINKKIFYSPICHGVQFNNDTSTNIKERLKTEKYFLTNKNRKYILTKKNSNLLNNDLKYNKNARVYSSYYSLNNDVFTSVFKKNHKKVITSLVDFSAQTGGNINHKNNKNLHYQRANTANNFVNEISNEDYNILKKISKKKKSSLGIKQSILPLNYIPHGKPLRITLYYKYKK